MKREQIIEIIKNNIQNIIVEDQLSGGDPPYLTHKYHNEWVGYDKAADAILALPLDVPSEDEVKKHMIEMNLYQHLDEFDNDVWDEGKLYWAIQGYKIASKWMKEEIIKRNK